jgi:hypothetical protein
MKKDQIQNFYFNEIFCGRKLFFTKLSDFWNILYLKKKENIILLFKMLIYKEYQPLLDFIFSILNYRELLKVYYTQQIYLLIILLDQIMDKICFNNINILILKKNLSVSAKKKLLWKIISKLLYKIQSSICNISTNSFKC